MSDVKVIKTKADVDKLAFGDAWVWDAPDDPEEAFDAIQKLEEELGQYLDDRFAAKFAVEFDETHVHITSDRDTTAVVGGDVKDGKVKLEADKTVKRKLTAEGNGFVTVNGLEHSA